MEIKKVRKVSVDSSHTHSTHIWENVMESAKMYAIIMYQGFYKRTHIHLPVKLYLTLFPVHHHLLPISIPDCANDLSKHPFN